MKEICKLLWLFILSPLLLTGQNQPSYDLQLIPDSLRSKAHVVVRLDQTEVEFFSSRKYISHNLRVYTILSQKGEEWADFRVYYKEGSSKIKDIQIKIFDSNGIFIRSVKSGEIEDFASFDGYSIISDARQKVFDYKPTSYPMTIEMSWKEESQYTLMLPEWRPIPSVNISIENSSYKIVNHTNIRIRMNKRNFEKFPITEITDYHYVLNNYPVLFYESFSTSKYDRYPILYVLPEIFEYEGYSGQYEDWKGYGKWIYNDLLSDRKFFDTELVKQDLEKLIPNGPDKINIAKRLYDYVQESTRYISIGLNEGGLVPLHANKVHEVKYGDCKALSYYMINLLKLYDISANYVEVAADSDVTQSLFEEFACPAPGNHIIVNIPLAQDTIWLDCTSHNNPFNFLGSFTDDRLALQISENGGQLVRTPIYTKEQNKNEVRGSIDFNANGDITAELSIADYGIRINQGFGLKRLDEKEINEYLTTSLLSVFHKLELLEQGISIDEDKVQSNQNYKFKASKYGETAGDYILFDVALLPMEIPEINKNSNRQNEIYFPRSQQFISRVSYHLPAGFFWKIPEELNLESDYGSYSQKVVREVDNKYIVTREFVLNKGTFQPGEYEKIKRYFDTIRKHERGKFSISNKS